MKSYVLVVAGSRSFASMDDSEFDHWMNLGLDVLGTPTTVIQGGAPGVDRKADRWRARALIDGITYPADWNRMGRSAGILRNVQMAEDADKALILWDGKSPGTRHMISEVVRRGLPSVVLTFGEFR